MFSKLGRKFWKSFCLLDNCIWADCVKFSLLQRKYLLSVVNILTNSPNNSHITKKDILQLDLPNSDEKL